MTKTSLEVVKFLQKNTLKFKSIMNFIANIVSDGNFSFTEDGITFTSMDNSQISLIDMLIQNSSLVLIIRDLGWNLYYT